MNPEHPSPPSENRAADLHTQDLHTAGQGVSEVKPLLVEDDPLDVLAIKRALNKAKIASEIVRGERRH